MVRRSANGGIVAASNDALSAATGEFVAFLDHDDLLATTALEQMAATIDSTDDIDYVYSDETHVQPDGSELAVFLKPDWCPERFRSSMYTCHFSVLRRDLVTELGGFREGFDGSQDHDLILRATETIAARGRRVVHLPRMLYFWRHVITSVSRASSSLTNAVARGRQAVQDQCDRLGLDAYVVHGPLEGTYRVVRNVAPETMVTVVVPTRGETAPSQPDRLAVLATMEALRTTHPATRLVVAYPATLAPDRVALLDHAAGDRWELLPISGDWSVAAALDRGFNECPCDVLVSVAPGLVPSDLTPDWLETLVGLARSPGAGVAGSLIADENEIILHAGFDVPNFRQYSLVGMPVAAPSAGNDLLIERECSHVSLAAAAVSAASLAGVPRPRRRRFRCSRPWPLHCPGRIGGAKRVDPIRPLRPGRADQVRPNAAVATTRRACHAVCCGEFVPCFGSRGSDDAGGEAIVDEVGEPATLDQLDLLRPDAGHA